MRFIDLISGLAASFVYTALNAILFFLLKVEWTWWPFLVCVEVLSLLCFFSRRTTFRHKWIRTLLKILFRTVFSVAVIAVLLQLSATQRSFADAWLESTRNGEPFGFFSFFVCELYALLLFIPLFAFCDGHYINAAAFFISEHFFAVGFIFQNQIFTILSLLPVLFLILRKKKWQVILIPSVCALVCSAAFAFYENKSGKSFSDFISIDTSKIMSVIAPDFPLMAHISGYGTSVNAEEPLYTVNPSQKEILSIRGEPFEIYYLSEKCYSSWDGEKWNVFPGENEKRNVDVFFADEKFVPHSNQIELCVRDDFLSVVPLTNLTESVTLPAEYSASDFFVSDSKSIFLSPGLKKDATIILRTGNHSDSEPDYAAVTSSKIPESIKELSEKLGASALEKKDYIASVLDYLHGEFKYSLESPKTPKDKDPYEFFLFTSKTGFCTWYAGSFVLLMHSAGIPCRMVEGYCAVTNGIGRANISGLQMHAWPEVYLDGSWQIFEATAVINAQNPYLFINPDDAKTKNYISKLLADSKKNELPLESEKKSFDFRFLIYGFIIISAISALFLLIRKIILSKNLSYRAKRIVKIYGRKKIPSPREIGWLQWKKEVKALSKTEKEIRLSKNALQIADRMIQKLYQAPESNPAK